MHEPDLQFKALNEGLGFHPFSNGLPYTPATPKRDFTRGVGVGALAAGRPDFVLPPNLVLPKESPPALPATIFDWNYVGRRFFAFIIDSAIGFSLAMAILITSLWSSLEVFANTNTLLITMAFLLFFDWALITAQEVAVGTTIGKKLFGLRLEGGAVTLLIRALFLGTGVLWCAIDHDRRGFHDWVTGIQPEEI